MMKIRNTTLLDIHLLKLHGFYRRWRAVLHRTRENAAYNSKLRGINLLESFESCCLQYANDVVRYESHEDSSSHSVSACSDRRLISLGEKQSY